MLPCPAQRKPGQRHKPEHQRRPPRGCPAIAQPVFVPARPVVVTGSYYPVYPPVVTYAAPLCDRPVYRPVVVLPPARPIHPVHYPHYPHYIR